MRLVPDKEIYGTDYGSKRYACVDCKANVGRHEEGKLEGEPLGIIADEELSTLRKRLHKYLDPLWRDTGADRQPVYNWIFGEIMGLPEPRRHAAMLTKDECRTLITELKMNRKRYKSNADTYVSVGSRPHGKSTMPDSS